jgi:hypothetical protein
MLGGCDRDPSAAPVSGTQGSPASDWFIDAAARSGLTFTHVNGASGALYDAEIFAPGVALFDYDNDGDLDVYLVQGQRLANDERPGNVEAPASEAMGDRLYRNDLTVAPDGTRSLTFTDVTDQSGIHVTTYGMGVAAGDIDNDGWVDLYLTRLGPNVMLHNNGNGTFTDISRQSGTDDPAWGVSAAFVDIDRDGRLDLYVGNYLAWSLESDKGCTTITGQPDYCPPAAYRPVADRLYLNQGGGTFRDISAQSGIARESGAALGVSTADFDGDGWMDIYVANDSTENVLWMNQHNGSFRNTALLNGVAIDAAGYAEASMGVDAGDFDNDGDEDLFIANITSEGHTLYVNDGAGGFEERGARSGLRPASLPYTGFGAAWFDADNDGWLDLLTANGAVRLLDGFKASPGVNSLSQHLQVFRNLADGRFEDVSARAGKVFQVPGVGRGAAFGDVDNDGDIDVLIGNNNGPVQLLINQGSPGRHWLGVRVTSAGPARDMLGARVGLVRSDGRTLWRRARADGSYASASDPRVHFGLGASSDAASIQVVWPDGRAERWTHVLADRWTTLTQGTGASSR